MFTDWMDSIHYGSQCSNFLNSGGNNLGDGNLVGLGISHRQYSCNDRMQKSLRIILEERNFWKNALVGDYTRDDSSGGDGVLATAPSSFFFARFSPCSACLASLRRGEDSWELVLLGSGPAVLGKCVCLACSQGHALSLVPLWMSFSVSLRYSMLKFLHTHHHLTFSEVRADDLFIA